MDELETAFVILFVGILIVGCFWYGFQKGIFVNPNDLNQYAGKQWVSLNFASINHTHSDGSGNGMIIHDNEWHEPDFAVFDHLHDDRYALIYHLHDDRYALIVHWHNETYSLIGHLHDDRYSQLGHTHDDRYALIVHYHDERYALITHDHDDRYYTETESDARYSLLGHTHSANDIVSGILSNLRGGLGKALTPTWTNDYILVYKSATDSWVMEAKPTGGAGAETIVKLTVDRSTTATTFLDVTGLSVTLNPNTDYQFEFHIDFQTSATTTGINLATNFGGTVTYYVHMTEIPLSASAGTDNVRTQQVTAFNTGTATASIDVANANRYARITGIIRVSGTGGTFILRFASEVSGSSVTIKAGSILKIVQI